MKTRSSQHRLAMKGVCALGVLSLGCGVAVSAAAYADQSNLNLQSSGIGSPDRFDIGLVMPDGLVEQADPPEGVDWPVAEAGELVPGRSVSASIPVFNNTPKWRADTVFEIVLRNGDGSVGANVPNITDHLRFDAEIDGESLFTGATWDEANGEIGLLAARGGSPLQGGDEYVAGSDGSEKTLELVVTYLDEAGVEALNGGQSALSVKFSAESVAP